MTAYYNEIDPFAAEWLRQLIKEGHIAPGDVDERDIRDVIPDELSGYTQCHAFAGIGVWSYALRQAGWPDDRPVWTGSCPCQPFSPSGKGEGFDDERHLWPDWFWLIEQCRPVTVFGEQVAYKDGLVWLDLVFADLEGILYTTGAANTPAAGYGAPHIRERLYWFANTERNKKSRKEPCSGTAGRVGRIKQSVPWDISWKSALSKFRALDDGYPRCVGGTDAARNAIVAEQAKAFIEAYQEVQTS